MLYFSVDHCKHINHGGEPEKGCQARKSHFFGKTNIRSKSRGKFNICFDQAARQDLWCSFFALVGLPNHARTVYQKQKWILTNTPLLPNIWLIHYGVSNVKKKQYWLEVVACWNTTLSGASKCLTPQSVVVRQPVACLLLDNTTLYSLLQQCIFLP